MATQIKEEPVEDLDTEVQTDGERDWEAEARDMGWKPLEEFGGDPADHKSAKDFVERGIRARKQRDHVYRDLVQLRRDMVQLREYHSKAEERAYERARADLEARMEQAVEAGDTATARKLMQDADKLHKEHTAPAKQQYSDADLRGAWDDFRDENDWYDFGALGGATEVQKQARVYADRIINRDLQKADEMSPGEFLSYIAEEVNRKYPALKQPASQRSRIPEVSGTTNRSTRGKAGQTFDDLPREAQQFCDRMVKQCLFTDRAEYLKDYQWEDRK